MSDEIKWTIELDDIEWRMEWGPQFPDKPPFEMKFDEEGALAHLLEDDGNPVLDDDERPIMVASRSWASNPWTWAISFRRLP